MEFKVLYEDNHIMVVEKPPKVPSQGDPTGDIDMITLVKEYLKNNYSKAKDPYVGLVHRLDRPVGGAMVFAKTKEANSFLSKQLQDKNFQKEYLVVACGSPETDKGELKDMLLKLSTINMSKVVEGGRRGAKEAILEYQVIDKSKDDCQEESLSLMKIILKTGRHHQIRVQLSHHGWPIWGDNKYNKAFVKSKEWTQIALWSHHLSFIHPKTKEKVTYISLPENQFPFSVFNLKEITGALHTD